MIAIESGVCLFQRYNIIKPIGKGGSSIVYLAKNIKVGNLVAIKVVSKKEQKFDLLTEKDILKELRHPAIPVIMDVEEDEEYLYLIEEYIEGIALSRLKLQLEEKEIIQIMLQLCDVLTYLHTSFQVPIIYRDLKPSNIIRMDNGHIKLIDFGIAKKYQANNVDDTSAYGTRGYAAPEQFGQDKADVRTDIFALGVCMYDMLTGKNLSTPPYKLKPIREIDPTISNKLEEVLNKCIINMPSGRYQSTKYLEEALREIGREDRRRQDYETFMAQGHKVITCIGMNRRIGTTHVTIMMANYFQKQGKKVAIIEGQSSETFSKVVMMHEDIKENRHMFELENVDYYFHHNKNNYINIMKKSYDLILIDYGYEMYLDKPFNTVGKEVIVICGSKDWELDEFENYYYNNPDKTFHYCFNFTDEEVFEEISESMEGFKKYLLPYNPNPYKIKKESIKMFEEIFGGETNPKRIVKRGIYEKNGIIKKITKKFSKQKKT